MNFVDDLDNLYKNNIITKDEYDILIKRLKINNSDYEYTWSDILNGFYEWCSNKYTVSTSKGYKTCLYKFMLYMTKEDDNEMAMNKKFEPYTFQKVNSFIKRLYSDGFKSQSVSKIKYAIDVLNEYLKEIGVDVPDTKNIKVSITKEVNNATIAFTQDEVIKIANYGDLRSKVCIMLCYEAALRRNELSSIRVQDFITKNNQLIMKDCDGNVDRVCSLTKETMEYVMDYIDDLYESIESWNNSRISRGKEPRDDFGYIFQSVKMIKPSYSLLQTMIKNNAKMYYESNGYKDDELNTKIQQVTFESIRNSRKVYLLSQGYSVNEVMRMCGDKNYMSTYRFCNLVQLLYPNK